MRAAIFNVPRNCWNCKALIDEHRGPWCKLHNEDPNPHGRANSPKQVCPDWTWDEEETE